VASSPPEARIGFLLKHAQTRLNALSAPALAELGLGAREWVVLSLVAKSAPCSQQALARQLRVDRTTMVALVDALERLGLVTRERDPVDRRAYALQLTPAGKRVAARGEKLISRAQEKFFDPLDVSERKQLLSALAKVVSADDVPPSTRD